LSLLLDENLSPRLTARLGSLFTDLIHVRDVGLKQADDQAIWDWAKQNRYNVVTADTDFVTIFSRRGSPPKLVHILNAAISRYR
jgi:predicted nuclease of predicted toxin-antitoxin system